MGTVYADILARGDGNGVVVLIMSNIHNKRHRCGGKAERDGWQLRESRMGKRKPYKRRRKGGHCVSSLLPLCSGKAWKTRLCCKSSSRKGGRHGHFNRPQCQCGTLTTLICSQLWYPDGT